MAKGRPKTPTKLKLVKGTAKKCRLNKKEPMPKNDKIKKPSWLSADAKLYWRDIEPVLTESGMLTNADTYALGMLCESSAQWVNTKKKIVNLLIKTPKGYPVQNPLLAINNRAFEKVIKLLTEFGMTPASRSRVEKTADELADGWGDFK